MAKTAQNGFLSGVLHAVYSRKTYPSERDFLQYFNSNHGAIPKLLFITGLKVFIYFVSIYSDLYRMHLLK